MGETSDGGYFFRRRIGTRDVHTVSARRVRRRVRGAGAGQLRGDRRQRQLGLVARRSRAHVLPPSRRPLEPRDQGRRERARTRDHGPADGRDRPPSVGGGRPFDPPQGEVPRQARSASPRSADRRRVDGAATPDWPLRTDPGNAGDPVQHPRPASSRGTTWTRAAPSSPITSRHPGSPQASRCRATVSTSPTAPAMGMPRSACVSPA